MFPLFLDNSKSEIEEDKIWGGLSCEYGLDFVIVFWLGFVEVGLEFGGIYRVECGRTRGGSSCRIGVVGWFRVEGLGDLG